MRGKARGEEVRAAVIAALLLGIEQQEVANQYVVPIGTVKTWWSAYQKSDKFNQVQPKKQEEIGELVLNALNSNLRSLGIITTSIGDDEYIKKQPANEIAVLYGVMADKAIRILGGLKPVEANGNHSGELEAKVLPGTNNPGGTKRD